MEVHDVQPGEFRKPPTHEQEKQRWAEEHARRFQRRFEQWQTPLGIDSQEYRKYLMKELLDCYDEPLRKSLVESIS